MWSKESNSLLIEIILKIVESIKYEIIIVYIINALSFNLNRACSSIIQNNSRRELN